MKTTLILLSAALALGCAAADDTAEAGGAAAGGAPAATAPDTSPANGAAPAASEEAVPAPDAAAPPAETAGPAPGAGTTAPAPAPELQQTDRAREILERAAAAYAEVRSLQASFTMSFENPLLRSRSTGSGTLYQKRPDRLLLRFDEPAGDVILSDGEYFWMYYPSTDATQVLRSAASAGGAAGVDLQAQFLGDPTRRFRSELLGEATVAGRPAWELRLTPREPLGYRQLRAWIDQRDYLARRFEITEENGSVRRFDLGGLRVNPTLANSLFEFDVPAGARVVTR